jgi:hypothetical protein
MASFSVTIAHQAFLERQANRLTERLGRKVSPKEILYALLDIAISDEGIYDPDSPTAQLISSERRELVQQEREQRTVPLDFAMLLSALNPDPIRAERINSAQALDAHSLRPRRGQSRTNKTGELLRRLR